MRDARFLIVDDEEDIRDMLALVLERERPDWKVRTAANAAEALRAFAQEPAAVVLTDFRMPGEDGLQLAAALAKAADPPSTVLMSAFADQQLALRARESGNFRGFLVKPFRATEVVHMLELALQAQDPAAGAALDAAFEGATDRLAGGARS